MNEIRLLKGDCLQKLKELKDNSVDSVVTDPPYEIGFMGKGWDDSGIANNPELWKEVLRVLKPGGHLLSFSHSRTYHRQAVAVEDAGFEIRDQIMWIYGSGFPKSHNIALAIDKMEGKIGNRGKAINLAGKGNRSDIDTSVSKKNGTLKEGYTSDNEYNGWGTALKPAHEPIVMARKPLSEKTIVKNVLEHGTGGINIDGCRVDNSDMKIPDNANQIQTDKPKHHSGAMTGTIGKMQVHNDGGRFPANIIFDEEAGKILDEQSGELKFSYAINSSRKKEYNNSSYGISGPTADSSKADYGKKGGASRFFYCPKASKKDRNDGLDHIKVKKTKSQESILDYSDKYNATRSERQNIHPTVKPTDLMAYLVRLVTPKGGTVLDPFMGSGSTGKASVREGFNFIGIEREDEYMEIAKSRIEHEQSKNKHRQFFE